MFESEVERCYIGVKDGIYEGIQSWLEIICRGNFYNPCESFIIKGVDLFQMNLSWFCWNEIEIVVKIVG